MNCGVSCAAMGDSLLGHLQLLAGMQVAGSQLYQLGPIAAILGLGFRKIDGV